MVHCAKIVNERPKDDFVAVSEVSAPSGSPNVEGVVTRVSPMKKSQTSGTSFLDSNIGRAFKFKKTIQVDSPLHR